MLTAIAAFFRGGSAGDETQQAPPERPTPEPAASHPTDAEDDYEIVDPDGDDTDTDSVDSPNGGRSSGSSSSPEPNESRTIAGQATPDNPPSKNSDGRCSPDDLPSLVPLTNPPAPTQRGPPPPITNPSAEAKRRSEINQHSPPLCGPPPPKPLVPYLNMEENMFKDPNYKTGLPATRQPDLSSYPASHPQRKYTGRYTPKGEAKGRNAIASLRHELDAESNLKNPASAQLVRAESIITQAPAPRRPSGSLSKLSPSKAQQIAEQRSQGTLPRPTPSEYRAGEFQGELHFNSAEYIRTWETNPAPYIERRERDRSSAGRREVGCSCGTCIAPTVSSDGENANVNGPVLTARPVSVKRGSCD